MNINTAIEYYTTIQYPIELLKTEARNVGITNFYQYEMHTPIIEGYPRSNESSYNTFALGRDIVLRKIASREITDPIEQVQLLAMYGYSDVFLLQFHRNNGDFAQLLRELSHTNQNAIQISLL